MDDKQIIALYPARAEEAISEPADKYGKLCRRIANNILGNDQDSEECVNDTYLGLWNAIPPTKPSFLPASAAWMRTSSARCSRRRTTPACTAAGRPAA